MVLFNCTLPVNIKALKQMTIVCCDQAGTCVAPTPGNSQQITLQTQDESERQRSPLQQQ